MTQAGSKLVSRHFDILGSQAGFQTATVQPFPGLFHPDMGSRGADALLFTIVQVLWHHLLLHRMCP